MNEVVKKSTIEELCAHRNRALALMSDAIDKLKEAYAAIGMAGPSGHYSEPETYRGSPYIRLPEKSEALANYRKAIDRCVWGHLIKVGQFETLMDHTARQQFRQQLVDDPPEATFDNCVATLDQLMMDSGMIFRRGIAVAFSGLDRRFKTHDGFKIGSKIILTYFHRDGYLGYSDRACESIRDIERVFFTLDGKPVPDHWGGILGQANNALGHRTPSCDVENEFFRLRAFKNGNAHLWFKRDDLVLRVNELLAEYYGEALGDARTKDSPGQRQGVAPRDMGFFATPAPVAAQVADRALLDRSPGQPALRVLEPSAGAGALIEAVLSKTSDVAPNVTAVEMDTARARGLAASGIADKVIGGDFLQVTPEMIGKFDRIVMNPPFDRGRDIDHVNHALRFLKPGGRLVAIMSAGTEFREDKKSIAFRDTVAAMAPKHEPQFIDLPPGSFKEAGTMANTVIVVLDMPG